MTIEFRCSACDRLLRTPDDTAGKQAKCPECGGLMQIPDSSHETAGPMPSGGEVESPFGSIEPAAPSATGNPFDSTAAVGGEGTASDNPYASPGDYQPAPMPLGVQGSEDLVAYAQARVSGPAVGLIVTGALGGVLQLGGLVFQIIALGMGGAAGGNDMLPMMAPGAINLVSGMVGIALAALVIVGAMKMQKLQSYPLSMTSAIVAMIPCFSPCCLIGLPFGIWALVVLSDGQVQAAFKVSDGRG